MRSSAVVIPVQIVSTPYHILVEFYSSLDSLKFSLDVLRMVLPSRISALGM